VFSGQTFCGMDALDFCSVWNRQRREKSMQAASHDGFSRSRRADHQQVVIPRRCYNECGACMGGELQILQFHLSCGQGGVIAPHQTGKNAHPLQVFNDLGQSRRPKNSHLGF
jgi:hypothetical protein